MKLFRKVAIVGAGLIGGSIGLAIKKQGLASRITGVSRHKQSLILAKKMRAIDCGSQDMAIIKGADLIILALPVSKILQLAPRISRLIAKDCLVTDVGSTKQEIVSGLERIFPDYLGMHPMAGSEKRGIANARPDLFKGSLCILTPTTRTKPQSLMKIKRLWAALGAKTISLSPLAHDRGLSFVSHLAHIAAFSLVNAVPGKYLRLASSGFKDSTRIASSDTQVWLDIFISNQANVVAAIKNLENSLREIKAAIISKDNVALSRILRRAKEKRDSLN